MSWSIELYRKALAFAADAHGNQKVPGTKHSYVVHLASVCGEVIAGLQHNPRAKADLAIACALLHDTLEDTKAKPVEVEEAFGRDIYMGVAALTKSKRLSRTASMLDSLNRIRKEPREVGTVKMADRIVNLGRPPFHWTPAKTRLYYEEAKVILNSLKSCSKHFAKRLRSKIREYELYL